VILTLKEKFGEISPLSDKNKVARNQAKYCFGKQLPKVSIYVKEKKDVIAKFRP